jgi:hypothetical protein
MHAVLLRCEIDDRPPPEVAAELGLSERQLRRERRAAHDAFARAFRSTVFAATIVPATASDIARLRLAEAVELHELGQGVLAQAAFASVASSAPAPARRIEALCLAAEAEFDALRHTAAAAHLADARSIVLRCARDLDDDAARAADEHIDFIAWMLRWQTAVCAGLATLPPIVLAPAGDDRSRTEPRRALMVRAAAAYATQRWEVGDGPRGRSAVGRAWSLLPTLDVARIKERLAVMMADAQMYGLSAPRGADRHLFRIAASLAASHGHVHTMLAARAEHIGGAAVAGPTAGGHVCESILRPFGACERRSMARAFAWAAQIVAQCESNPQDAVTGAQLAEGLSPARSASALVARCTRATAAIAARRYEEAEVMVQSVYADAESVGNGRVRGTAARNLSAIALGCRRRSEAQRYIREALSLSEHFASPEALARVNAIARRLDVA